MKPVAIFQHDPLQRPGYLLQFLDEAGIASRIIRPTDGDDVPRTARSFSGAVFLGSDASVNDHLPWIERELRLVGDAVACGVPVLGHCFGGQLLARALGAAVQRSPWPNIGWARLRTTPAACALFGGNAQVLAFNWHYETFAIPHGATRTLFGEHCLNKGFVHGRNLAFQSHFEVTEEIIRGWCAAHRDELVGAAGPAVQSETAILDSLAQKVAAAHKAARCAYAAWAAPLIRPPRLHHVGPFLAARPNTVPGARRADA
jgi:GMP synthase (glutamine-hydrolysing)